MIKSRKADLIYNELQNTSLGATQTARDPTTASFVTQDKGGHRSDVDA